MNWDDTTKAGLLGYAQANMDALQNWFFWTWKIGNSTTLGYAPSPFWHYKLGWRNGWMPKDPRVAGGYCGSVMQVGGSQVGLYPTSTGFHELIGRSSTVHSQPPQQAPSPHRPSQQTRSQIIQFGHPPQWDHHSPPPKYPFSRHLLKQVHL